MPNIVLVQDPRDLLAASALFDHEVSLETATDFLSQDGHVALLAVQDGKTSGFVTGMVLHHPDKAPEMFVDELAVDDSAQRAGVATALLTGLTRIAADRGCRTVWTATETTNDAARATYRKLGATLDEQVVVVEWSTGL